MGNERKNKQLSKKEYLKLSQSAYELVVVKGFEQKEAAQLLNVSEQTMSSWAQKGNWRKLREDRQLCKSTDADNLKKLINCYTKRLLELEDEINDAERDGDVKKIIELRVQAKGISDQMSKTNKSLENVDKGKYTLGTYIDVMDDLFNELRKHDEETWGRTIEFQQLVLRKKSIELG